MRKLLFPTLLVIGLVSVMGGSAWAVDYPATTGSLTVSASSASAGSSIQVRGCGFAPGATVQIKIDSELMASMAASESGCISTSVTVPDGLSSGVHRLTATGLDPSGGTLTLSGSLTVPGSSSTAFGVTGANSALIGGVALMVVAVGALLVVVTRRRRAMV